MKRIISLVLAAAALFVGGLAVASPAQAAPPSVGFNDFKFWSPSICVEPGQGIPDSTSQQTYYRLAYLAQQWNLRTSTLALDYSTDCAADGYPPSRRMVIGTYSNASDYYCQSAVVNPQSTFYNGFYRWTNGPGLYINTANPYCVGTQTNRDHQVSSAIGYLLGLGKLNSAGYNSRVMNDTQWSRDNIGLPDVYSGAMLTDVYNGVYCDSGTAC